MDFNELKEMAKISDRIADEDERRLLEHSHVDDSRLVQTVKNLEEAGIGSTILTPLVRMMDRKDIFPVQGKESDGEIMFRFEDLMDAQNLYDFMVNLGLVEPGEIKLHVSEHQVSVHFQSGVLMSKPEAIQVALMAYEESRYGDEENDEAFESLVQDVEEVLMERTKVSGAPKKRAKGNPFHDKDGRLAGADAISGSKGGSFSMGKTKLKFTGDKKAKSGDKVVNFASTKRPCGRNARTKGKNIRCWDGSAMEAVSTILVKKNGMQQIEDAELEMMIRVLDGIEEDRKLIAAKQ